VKLVGGWEVERGSRELRNMGQACRRLRGWIASLVDGSPLSVGGDKESR
jgi:hypothetical protein